MRATATGATCRARQPESAVFRAFLPLALLSFGCEARDTTESAPLLRLASAETRIPEQAVPRTSSSPARRLFCRVRKAWIRAAPDRRAPKLGYLRAGAALPTGGEPTRGTDGCAGGWYAVAPKGYVCSSAVTFDESDPIVQLTAKNRPVTDRKLPYLYGTVRRPGPVYDRMPSAQDLATQESDLPRRIESWLSEPGENGASYAQEVWLGEPGQPPDPRTAWREQRTDQVATLLARQGLIRIAQGAGEEEEDEAVVSLMRPRAGYAFLQTFFWQGRRYGLTANLKIAPTDRFRPIRGSDFRGVEVGRDLELPFAFVRHPRARFYDYHSSTDAVRERGPATYRAAIPLTGKQAFFRGRLHYETADGAWISDLHASRIDAARRMPAWGTNGERWIDINLTKQVLVAYDGVRPVFATLISSGEAGLEDHEHSTATKRGIFRIHTKHLTSTMSSDEAGEAFELRDVPYVQYFDEGYALHGAYWHDRFGTPKSHGCINLSPHDARRLFFFTEPALPEEWHGVLLPLRGTVVFVHP